MKTFTFEGETYIQASEFSQADGDHVVIRDHMAGVYVGTLKSYDPVTKVATLLNARKCWRWAGAAAVNGIAVKGIKYEGSKIAPAVPQVTMSTVVECIMCTDVGYRSVMEAPEWKV